MGNPRRLRHWKQRWSPDADLIFTKRLRMGVDPEHPYVMPGDPVTDEMRSKLGTHRLRRWWEGGYVALADWETPGKSKTETDSVPQVSHDLSLLSVRIYGRGMHEITYPDGTKQKVRGVKAAEKVMREWADEN